jgi:hypothetical protein
MEQPITAIHLTQTGTELRNWAAVVYMDPFHAVTFFMLLIACINETKPGKVRAEAKEIRSVGSRLNKTIVLIPG